MQVLTGRPGSGKTRYILDRVRTWLRQRVEFRLIVPTNTMAEHTRNQLAREGFVFRPGAIITFSKFVESLIPDLPPLSAAALEMLVEEALAEIPLQQFEKVKRYPGFRKAAMDQIQELAAAGYSSRDLRRHSDLNEFIAIFAYVEKQAAQRGWHFPAHRLRTAAARVPVLSNVVFHGFFSFTRPELTVVAALAKGGAVLLSLPSWEGTAETMVALRTMGCEEIQFPADSPATVKRVLVTPPTADQEADEIARRILAARSAGREFREIGIVVRSEHPGAKVLRCALERFGIPARFYFGEPLGENPVTAYLAALVEAMLDGWEHGATIAALRKGGIPLDNAADEFEYVVQTALPNAGLAALRLLAAGKYDPVFNQLERLDGWRSKPAAAREWTARFRGLTGLYPAPQIRDDAGAVWLAIWRAQAAALAGLEACVDELGTLLDPAESLTCAEYWQQLKTVIEAATLRIPDNRRNVVHVMDAYEARQWKLPVVFLCGLLEKQFPKHHSQSPLLSDAVRLRLREAGISLRTTSDRHEEERFLFELATSRATSMLVLSYPLLNAKGEANLPSFFLEKLREDRGLAPEPAVRCRPVPSRAQRPIATVSIYDEGLRAALETRYSSIRTTALETFLQCPFQLFAQSTLQLQEAPLPPEERLNPMLQGSIAHRALQRLYTTGESLPVAFQAVWDEESLKARVPNGYRTEAVRIELFRNLETFVNATQLPRTAKSEFERPFRIEILDGVTVTGKIDRIDIDEQGRALVVDYKYKNGPGIKGLVAAHEEGHLVQGGIYLRAIRASKYQPAGMIYAGFRSEASFGGWVAGGAFPDLKNGCSPEELNDVVRRATEVAVTAIGQIHDGRITPAPADIAKCEYCAFAVACRVETIAAQKGRGGTGDESE